MLSKEEIEKFIQEMTEVRPDKLNKESLKLYNTIMQILDKNDKLETENKELKTDKQKLIEKLEETRNNLENDGYVGYADEIQEILKIAKGEK